MAPPAPSIGYNATSYSIPLVLLVDHPLISHDDYVPVSFYQLAVRQPVATQWRVAATDIPAVNGKIVDGAYTYDEDGAQLRGQFAFRLRAVSSSGVMSSWGPELETETLHQGVFTIMSCHWIMRVAVGAQVSWWSNLILVMPVICITSRFRTRLGGSAFGPPTFFTILTDSSVLSGHAVPKRVR